MASPELLTSRSRNDVSRTAALSLSSLKPSLRSSKSSRSVGTRSHAARLQETRQLTDSLNDAVDVERLNQWNTKSVTHLIGLETEFKSLYRTIEAEDSVHSSYKKRLEGSARIIGLASGKHETLRSKMKTQYVRSRQAKEFEDRLGKEYTATARHLNGLKETARQESTLVCELRAQLHDLLSEKYKLESVFAREESDIKALRRHNFAAYNIKQEQFQLLKSKSTTNFSLVIESMTAQISIAVEKVEARRVEIEALKENMRVLKTALVNHYTQILKEGTDTRVSGLRWVVIELWKCEVKLLPSMFPSFLDTTSAEVIMELAVKEQEILKLQQTLHDLYQGAKHGPRDTTEKPLNDLKSRLSKVRADNLTREKTVEKFDKFTRKFKVIREVVKDDSFFSQGIPQPNREWNRIIDTEKKIEALKVYIEDLQTAEVRRVAHDHFYVISATRPEKDRRVYLAAIVGSEAVDRYMNLVKRVEKDVRILLEKTKTFNFSKM